MFTEWIHLYLARDLVAVEAAPEPTEVLEVVWMPFAEALRLAREGAVSDAKTIAGLFRAAAHLDPPTGA